MNGGENNKKRLTKHIQYGYYNRVSFDYNILIKYNESNGTYVIRIKEKQQLR